jgi:hypothetical protein
MFGVCSTAHAADLRGYKGVSWGATPQQVARALYGVSCIRIDHSRYKVEETDNCGHDIYINGDGPFSESFWFRDGGLTRIEVRIPADQATRAVAAYKARLGPPASSNLDLVTWEWEVDQLNIFIKTADGSESKVLFLPYTEMVNNLRLNDKIWIKSESRATPRTPSGTKSGMPGWVLVSPPYSVSLLAILYNALQKQQKGLPLGGFDTFLVNHYAPGGKEIGSLLLRNDLPLVYWTKRQVFDSAEACTAEEKKIGWAKLEAEQKFAPLGAIALSFFNAQCVPAAAYFTASDE